MNKIDGNNNEQIPVVVEDNGKNNSVKKINSKVQKIKNKKGSSKSYVWTIKITIITFFLAAVFSLVSNIITSKTGLVIASLMTLFLIVIAIISDGIAIAVTSCDLAPLLALASRKIKGSKIAIKLVKNSEKVASICADVIGDICGIISGACSIIIVAKILELAQDASEYWVTIFLSSLIAAITVGGKSYLKIIAIKNSKEMVMFIAKVLSIFTRDK